MASVSIAFRPGNLKKKKKIFFFLSIAPSVPRDDIVLFHAALENVGGAYSTQKPIRRVVLVIISVTVFTFTHPPVLSALLLRLAFQIPRTRLHGLHCWFLRLFSLQSFYMEWPPHTHTHTLRLCRVFEQMTLCRLSLLHNLQQDWRFTNINFEEKKVVLFSEIKEDVVSI